MKKDNEKEKLNKFKELYNNYKEAKKDPVKKAGMKLLGYFIFFLILVLVANISSEFDKKNTQTTTKTTTTKIIDSYVEKQKDLLTNKYNINYEIKCNDIIYKINGTLENNIINGYLEKESVIKKIIIKNNVIYENDIVLETEFKVDNLNLNNIINTIKQTSAFIKEKDNVKTYLYELDAKKIYIECNEEQIVSIKVEEDNNVYTMNFDK